MSVKSMPVGYRFRPTDQELVDHYLKLKNQGFDRHVSNIQEIDVCKWEPWEIPGQLGSESDDQEWYFFGRRNTKYAKSNRSNRATKDGYWKPTGKDRYVKTSPKTPAIGTKKTLVFYKGRAQKSVRTNWVMHEYCAAVDKHNPQAFVLYVLKKKPDEDPEILIPDIINPVIPSPSAPLPSTPSTQNYLPDTPRLDDDINFDELESYFYGQPPMWDPANPLADVYPNQGPVHTTARYLNVSNNGCGVTQIQNHNTQKEAVDNIFSVTSTFMQTPETVPLDSTSGTETDNYVPQSLFDEDALHGGSTYLSDSESSNSEFYNDMILAQEVSLSTNSGIIHHAEMEADDSPGKFLYKAKSNRIPDVIGNKASGAIRLLGRNSHNTGFIVYAENPRMNNGTAPMSNYILNIAIGIFLTVVITGEVLFGLVS